MTEDTIKQIAQRFGAIYEDRIVFHDDKFTEFAEAVVAALESRVLAESDKQEAVQLTLSGAQLLEAFNFVAPDHPNDADQLECDVTIQWGEGHSGQGHYCWITDYPDEGAILLDGKQAEGIAAPPTIPVDAEPVASDKQEAADAKPVAQIVGDDKTRRLIWRCNAFDYDAGTELYAHPIASADVRDAERWRETLKHIGLWLSGGRRMVWAFGDGIPVPPETDYYKDSAAQRFVQAIDAALSQASKGNEND